MGWGGEVTPSLEFQGLFSVGVPNKEIILFYILAFKLVLKYTRTGSGGDAENGARCGEKGFGPRARTPPFIPSARQAD